MLVTLYIRMIQGEEGPRGFNGLDGLDGERGPMGEAVRLSDFCLKFNTSLEKQKNAYVML